MSLRDQLLAKGLVDKKAARRLDREEKQKRKKAQGSRKRQHLLDAEAAAAAAAKHKSEQEDRDRKRREANAARDAYEQALRVRNIVIGHRTQNKGGRSFFYKGTDGKTLHRMDVHPKVAEQLANGGLGIAYLDMGNRIDHTLIQGEGARKLIDIGAEDVLLHWAPEIDKDDGDVWVEPDWDVSLRPHRVR